MIDQVHLIGGFAIVLLWSLPIALFAHEAAQARRAQEELDRRPFDLRSRRASRNVDWNAVRRDLNGRNQ